jgi:type IV pilus assembly protein PilP
MKLRISSLAVLLVLVGCGQDRYQDLQAFMHDSEKGMRRTIEPLPQMRPYEPFEYKGYDLPEPFRPRKLTPSKSEGGGLQPDLNRRREPLESFPLESLKMVGMLEQKQARYAIVRADNTLYRVHKGNYMGQNFGLVMDITDTDVKLKEIVQDSAGDWAERASTLQLIDDTTGDKKR